MLVCCKHTALTADLLQLADAQEFYGDFMVLDSHHFVVPVLSNDVLINPKAAAALGASE